MPVSAIDVEYHQQDDGKLCGSACAQMVSKVIAPAITDQTAFSTAHALRTIDFFAAPDRLRTGLESHFSTSFALRSSRSQADESRAICWAIHHYKVPAIAAAYAKPHWIIVTNYDVDRDPSSPSDGTFKINGFFIHNPNPHVLPGFAEPPHPTGDGCGDATGKRGYPNHHVSIQDWQTIYFRAVKKLSPWRHKFVAIVRDDTPPAPDDGATPASDPTPSPPQTPDGVTDADIIAGALQGLEANRLLTNAAWAVAITGTRPGQPQRVIPYNDPKLAYFIVPFIDEADSSRIPVLVNVSAAGTYLESVAQPEGTTVYLDRARISALFPNATIADDLTWEPCLESFNTFWPFYVLNEGETRFFVRIDGTRFDELTEVIGEEDEG